MSDNELECPVCEQEECFLSCENRPFWKRKVADLESEIANLNVKYKAAMERIAELSRSNAG